MSAGADHSTPPRAEADGLVVHVAGDVAGTKVNIATSTSQQPDVAQIVSVCCDAMRRAWAAAACSGSGGKASAVRRPKRVEIECVQMLDSGSGTWVPLTDTASLQARTQLYVLQTGVPEGVGVIPRPAELPPSPCGGAEDEGEDGGVDVEVEGPPRSPSPPFVPGPPLVEAEPPKVPSPLPVRLPLPAQLPPAQPPAQVAAVPPTQQPGPAPASVAQGPPPPLPKAPVLSPNLLPQQPAQQQPPPPQQPPQNPSIVSAAASGGAPPSVAAPTATRLPGAPLSLPLPPAALVWIPAPLPFPAPAAAQEPAQASAPPPPPPPPPPPLLPLPPSAAALPHTPPPLRRPTQRIYRLPASSPPVPPRHRVPPFSVGLSPFVAAAAVAAATSAASEAAEEAAQQRAAQGRQAPLSPAAAHAALRTSRLHSPRATADTSSSSPQAAAQAAARARELPSPPVPAPREQSAEKVKVPPVQLPPPPPPPMERPTAERVRMPTHPRPHAGAALQPPYPGQTAAPVRGAPAAAAAAPPPPPPSTTDDEDAFRAVECDLRERRALRESRSLPEVPVARRPAVGRAGSGSGGAAAAGAGAAEAAADALPHESKRVSYVLCFFFFFFCRGSFSLFLQRKGNMM